MQSGAALQTVAVLTFPYASGTQSLDIVYARVRKPDGTVIETPLTDGQDQPAPATQAAPMYSDLRVKQLPVRSLAVGDTLEFDTKTLQNKAEIPGQFWGAETFGIGLVYLNRRIELRVPKTKRVTVYSPKYPPETTDTGDDRVYRWAGSQLRRSNAKDDGAPKEKIVPIAWTTFPSWVAVGEWYGSLIAGRDAVTPALQAKADEVTAAAKTDGDKVRALYEYVSAHNHYIAVDFGIGRYQPHSAAEVLANQYGDCKDKHTLLAALLRAKGFQPSAALIGAGVEMNEAVPSPGAFNHLITFVMVDGAPVWLDATTEVAPYRVLLPLLRDKQALVVPPSGGPGPPHLAKTPAELPFPAIDRYEGTFTLAADGTTKGDVVVTLRGDDEVLMRYASRQVARAQWDQLGQAFVDNSGFNGKANTVRLDAGDDLAAPWAMRYGYTQEAWAQWKNFQVGSLLPNVNLPSIDEKKPPKEPIDFGGRHTQTATSTVKLPPGYSAELPDAIHLKTQFASFDQIYRVVDGSLVSEFTLEVLKAKVEAAEWKDVKKFTDGIGVQPWIQLTSKERAAGAKGPPPAGENNPAAAELVRQAQNAIMAHDDELARKKIDEAAALNEKQAYLWSVRASLAERRRDFPQAVADFQRELAQHPDELEQYGGLTSAEYMAGNKAEERKYLLAYATAAPENPQVVLYVGGRLLAEDHVDDAVSVLRSGAKALPDNRMIQVQLGSALLAANKKEEALPILESALTGASDPGVLNDGAYELARTGSTASLPLAETSAHKAVDMLETELAGTPVEGANATSFRRTTVLLAAWDTLGWVYFAEGKDALAEPYVRAAWRSTGGSAEGLHMGQILEKKGDLPGAMRTYEMALSQTRSNSGTPVAAELHARVDALKKKGIPPQDVHPERALQDGRTFHLPRSSGVSGSATYALGVSAAGTQRVAMMGGDEPLRSFTAAVNHLDLNLAVPRESQATLLRKGILFCATGPTCDFVLVPPGAAAQN